MTARDLAVSIPSTRGVGSARGRSHWPLSLTIALLPFTYVPHEIVRIDLKVSYVQLAMVVTAGLLYGAFRGRLRALEVVAILLGAWALSRLLLISYLDTGVPEVGKALREGSILVTALVHYRLASRPELRPAVLRGLVAALCLMLTMEAYQLTVGLDTLLALGYESPDFNYNTADGGYRPFGTMQSPVVFGTYLAMVGLVVTLGTRRWVAAAAFVATSVGIALTQTRSALIAFAVGLGVALLMQPKPARGGKLLLAVPVLWATALAAVLRPELFSSLFARLGSVTDTTDTSGAVRLDLWAGTLRAAAGRPVDGYGATEFALTMQRYVGALSEYGHPHNTYLQVLYLYGVVGMALFIAVIVLALHPGHAGLPADRVRIAAVAAVLAYAIGAFFEATWTSFNMIATLFIVAGLSAGTAYPQEKSFRT
ncbi:O-antigen ligase family protein [Pseudonocardia sp.]|uniref:O-antigen ligase family protein n=1 Tax=Pseudonocardia sp. TaxID=60912 RepID=UPI003D0D1231